MIIQKVFHEITNQGKLLKAYARSNIFLKLSLKYFMQTDWENSKFRKMKYSKRT